MDTSSWDGSLSKTEFDLAVRSFAEKWKRNNTDYPPWLWVSCPKQPWLPSHDVEGYSSLEKIRLYNHGSSEEDSDRVTQSGEEETTCGNEDAIDSAMLVQSSHSEVYYYDLHVVYSASYRVPVLYFRVYGSDGRPLALDEIEKVLPSCSAKILLESKWTFITQEEHPYLHRPWYKLHPCGTSEWMKLMLVGDASVANLESVIELYLVSWLSFVGQVVGLRVPFKMLDDKAD
ncbi:ubiquitin-like-conjugating enzyme ATG10 isoform X1 [Tripterygium wilfordii]|uniref:Ubiquitin-like-conjugating enzyme ATG10 n=1 Tax=Tripterygium wilfordii TaxID=458696 RepID=A0A7J7DJ35_TRIWF|nr:ubiquitin-like-conjugating enzyme ATG10 [Tripterygium wilfordii]XP_038702844.1 ubiquitin-like-conjugating enzyme ATG10 [Tripterygium wilfordii]KAF5746244.1 ubiquitin-like-conjugating enzyme ATG10 isoform X1 [Tripterygium wilfordii]